MDSPSPVVDFSFPLAGTTIPVDHGYVVYSAVSHVVPRLHADNAVGIHPIGGRLVGGRLLELGQGRSELTLRIPADRISEYLPLAGRKLNLNGSAVRLGVPRVYPLRPAAALISRLVTVKGFVEPQAFLENLKRRLHELGIEGDPALVTRRGDRAVEGRSVGGSGSFVRRTLRIHGREIVGFEVLVDHLTAEESLRLQEAGLGGRRRFGCGLFVKVRA